MARIAGIMHKEGQGTVAPAQALVALMSTAAGSGVTLDRCAMAGAGRDMTICEASNCIAAVDGVFFNAEELNGDAGSPAAQLVSEFRQRGFAEALKRVNGDFAAAVYDGQSRRLWLGRDRIGVKPMYYAEAGGAFGFSSRPNPLRALPGVPKGANRRYLAVFAGSHYRYIDNEPEKSPFEGVLQLPAGTCLLWDGARSRLHRYWELSEQDDWSDDEGTLAERYRALLLDSVGRRLRAAKRPIFTLSGGMDSSSVLACAVELGGRRQDAVSSVYSDKTYDESDDIRGFVAEKVDQWRAVPIEGFDLFETVAQMVRAHDEPVATATWLSHYLLTHKVAEEGYDIVFGGLGGDELNAGEYEYFVFNFADLRARELDATLTHEIECWARHHDHPIYRKNADAAAGHLARLAGPRLGQVLIDRERLERHFGAVHPSFYALEHFAPVLDHPYQSWLKNRTYQDIFRETAPCCLRAEDRNCEAAGLSHADPFFDYRLVEFMFRVPGHMKIRDGVTKRLLREAMRGILPEETRTRVKKTGWNAPAHVWFSGKTLEQLQDMVASRAFRERGLYDIKRVQELIAEHRSIIETGAVKENHMMFLWQLLNAEMWLRHVVNSVPEISGP